MDANEGEVKCSSKAGILRGVRHGLAPYTDLGRRIDWLAYDTAKVLARAKLDREPCEEYNQETKTQGLHYYQDV